MRCQVAYYEGGAVFTADGKESSAMGRRDGVLWVLVSWTRRGFNFTHRLRGADFYWFTESMYGMICDGSCCPPSSRAWQITDDRAILIDPPAINDAMLLRGILLPDDEWRRVLS